MFLTELGIADDPEQVLHLDAKLLAETLIKVSPRDIGDLSKERVTSAGARPGATQVQWSGSRTPSISARRLVPYTAWGGQ